VAIIEEKHRYRYVCLYACLFIYAFVPSICVLYISYAHTNNSKNKISCEKIKERKKKKAEKKNTTAGCKD
jgi:hypothetical protein